MEKGGHSSWINIAFWVVSIALFSMPIIGALYKKNQKIVPELVTIAKSDINKINNPTPSITVHLAGAVKKPGIYQIKIGTKLHELLAVVERLPNSSIDHLNLAKTLRDGQRIVVKKVEQPKYPININLASKLELMQLPGVGEVSAKKIIIYRQQVGAIKNINQLTEIDGIGVTLVKRLNGKLIF